MDQSLLNSLGNLPIELQLKIVLYLKSSGSASYLVHFDQFESLKALTLEPSIIREMNFSCSYRFGSSDLRFLKDKFRKDVITSLNINGIYWMRERELFDCLKQLKSLKILYAVDTKLKFDVLMKLVPQTSIEKLAFTTNTMNVSLQPEIGEKITDLLIHCDRSLKWNYSETSHLRRFLAYLSNLQNLVIVSFTSTGRHLSELEDFTFRNMAIISYNHYSEDDCCQNRIIQGVLSPSGELISSAQRLRLLFAKDPNGNDIVGFNNIYNLVCSEIVIKTIERGSPKNRIPIEELNVAQNQFICNESTDVNKYLIEKVLLSENCRTLRKLAVCLCLCRDEFKHKPRQEGVFKKARLDSDVQSNNEETILKKIFENCPLIEELEIRNCSKFSFRFSKTIMLTENHCASLNGLKKLKRFALHKVPANLHITCGNPSTSCDWLKSLESISVINERGNTHFDNIFCQSLQQCISLRDMRWSNFTIPVERILDSINRLQNLERLVLECRSMSTFPVPSLETLLKNNRNLRFLYVSGGFTQDNIKLLNNFCKPYKTGPEKIFLFVKYPNIPSSVPNIHYSEMLMPHSKVCVFDLFRNPTFF